MEVRHLVRAVLHSGILRVWTGVGDHAIDEPFKPDGSAPGDTGTYTSDVKLIGVAGATMRFGYRGRGLVGTPVVGRVVDVFMVGRRPDDDDWVLLPGVRRGLLDNPMLEGGVYSVEVGVRRYPVAGEQWSHEEHERAYPGDTFFSQARAIAKGINGIHFPGVPNFDPDGEYDTRALQQPIGRPGGAGSPDDGLSGTPITRRPGVVLEPGSTALLRLTGARSSIRSGF